MPVQVYWDTEFENVIMYVVEDVWTWTDIIDAFQSKLKLVETLQGQRYHTIVDMQKTSILPDTNSAIAHLREIYQQIPPNEGHIVFVTQNQFFLIFLNLFMRVVPHAKSNMFIKATVDEAYEWIKAEVIRI